MRVGAVLSLFPALPTDEYLALVRDVDARGYATAWMGEVAGADAVTLMTLVASVTTRLGVASGVVPIQTRTPVVLGMTAATLAHLAPGRVTLGLGVSSRAIVEQWHGLAFAPAVEQVREAVTIIRGVAAGERVSVDGKHYRVRNFRSTAPPPANPPRIVLAALGPEMLELAGEIADGVLLNWMTPGGVPQALARVEAGARRAGRSLDGFEVAAFIRTCVTADAEPVRRALAREITGYASVESYARFLAASGFGAEIEAVTAAWRAGDRPGAVAQVTPRLLDALGVVGDAATCRARIAEFARAGLTMPVVLPFAGGGDVGTVARATLGAFP